MGECVDSFDSQSFWPDSPKGPKRQVEVDPGLVSPRKKKCERSDLSSLTYITVDQVVEQILQLGRGTMLDVEQA